jgi:uncharacterized protein YecT (DUF1311 family)
VEQESRRVVQRTARKINPTLIALLAGVILVLGLVAYFATGRSPNQDKLSDEQIARTEEQEQPASPEKRCSSKATYDLIKRELFRRAAEGRGSDQAAFDEVEAYAVLRMENAVLESEDSATGALNCSGSLFLDLPPGVVAAGGRRTLTADMDFTIDASGNVTIRNPEVITAPLATLARVAAPPPAPGITDEVEPEGTEGNVAASESATAPVGPATGYPGRPSFDCSRARTRGEIAVCSDPSLSVLDVNMTRQYQRALGSSTPQQHALLQSTRNRFIAYRDGCPNRQCIADAYIGRMREIRDIMEGRLLPGR